MALRHSSSGAHEIGAGAEGAPIQVAGPAGQPAYLAILKVREA